MTVSDYATSDEAERIAAPIRRAVERISYKSGWRLAVLNPPRPWLWPRLAIEFRSTDSVDGDADGYFGRSVDIHPQALADQVIEEMLRLILDAEIHEVLEWFCYAGGRVCDPHIFDAETDELAGNPRVGGVRFGRAVTARLADPSLRLFLASPDEVAYPWPGDRPRWPTDVTIVSEVLAELERRFPDEGEAS